VADSIGLPLSRRSNVRQLGTTGQGLGFLKLLRAQSNAPTLIFYGTDSMENVMAAQAAVNPSEEAIRIGPLGIRFLLSGEDTNGSVSVFEVTVPARQKLAAPAHTNDAYEETLYGIEGVLTWTVDGKAIELGPGQALCIPRGAVHRFDNFGTEDAKQLSIVTPAIMGPAYFREASQVVNAAAGGPPDTAKMVEIFRRHGMTIAAPSPTR
jgi:quercetin dioxygenase-like cupin family protein